MKKKVVRISKKGKPPGTSIYIGEERSHQVHIEIHEFSPTIYNHEQYLKDVSSEKFNRVDCNYWIDINGIHDSIFVEHVCSHYHIHSLTVEDILNTYQRAKADEYPLYTFVTCKMILSEKLNEANGIEFEQFSMLLLKNSLITFQEVPGDNFNNIRQRFHIENSRLRQKGPDYLLYLLLDTIVDEYIDALEIITNQVEELEQKIADKESYVDIDTIKQNKNQLIKIRKFMHPMREVVIKIQASENNLIKPETLKYFNDLMDHVHQVLEQIDFLMDMNKSLQDLHFSTLSLRMNKIMETLTIITAIFIPLTFIVGVYGMNFVHMPELEHPLGYVMVWSVMVGVAVMMILWFKRRKWL
jgi:magnesium transporter